MLYAILQIAGIALVVIATLRVAQLAIEGPCLLLARAWLLIEAAFASVHFAVQDHSLLTWASSAVVGFTVMVAYLTSKAAESVGSFDGAVSSTHEPI